MTGYEYLCVYIATPLAQERAKDRTDLLNEYASDGWELVSAGDYWAYFRRSMMKGSPTADEYLWNMVKEGTG